MLQQLVGINVVFYYGAVLWQSVGFSEADALLTNVVNGAVSLLACAIAMTTIDRVGRKPLLILGSTGMAIALGVMAVAFSTAADGVEGGGVLGPVAGPLHPPLRRLPSRMRRPSRQARSPYRSSRG